jgi:hypothetical protein
MIPLDNHDDHTTPNEKIYYYYFGMKLHNKYTMSNTLFDNLFKGMGNTNFNKVNKMNLLISHILDTTDPLKEIDFLVNIPPIKDYMYAQYIKSDGANAKDKIFVQNYITDMSDLSKIEFNSTGIKSSLSDIRICSPILLQDGDQSTSYADSTDIQVNAQTLNTEVVIQNNKFLDSYFGTLDGNYFRYHNASSKYKNAIEAYNQHRTYHFNHLEDGGTNLVEYNNKNCRYS